jgi:phage host-nuclease inhibitor protein Gam
MNRMKDLRIMTPEAADGVMAKIARTETSIELHKARANSKIATIKAELTERLAPLEAERESLGSALKQFVESFRGLFSKPRKRKSEAGEYGLQTVTSVEIADEEQLLDHLMECGYDDCFETVHKLKKPAIKKRMASGCDLPGVSVVTGDTAVYKVNPELLKDARDKGVRC